MDIEEGVEEGVEVRLSYKWLLEHDFLTKDSQIPVFHRISSDDYKIIKRSDPNRGIWHLFGEWIFRMGLRLYFHAIFMLWWLKLLGYT